MQRTLGTVKVARKGKLIKVIMYGVCTQRLSAANAQAAVLGGVLRGNPAPGTAQGANYLTGFACTLYGSQARGDATRESDIDLLVVLPAIDNRMVKTASYAAWEVGFNAGRVLSVIPDTRENMKRYAFLPFYRNIRKEGVVA